MNKKVEVIKYTKSYKFAYNMLSSSNQQYFHHKFLFLPRCNTVNKRYSLLQGTTIRIDLHQLGKTRNARHLYHTGHICQLFTITSYNSARVQPPQLGCSPNVPLWARNLPTPLWVTLTEVLGTVQHCNVKVISAY